MTRDKVSTLLLFGATGDLSHRMLLPSLYGLHADGLLPEGFRIVCTARSELDDEGFRQSAIEALKEHVPASFYDPKTALVFSRRLTYVPLDATVPGRFARLAEKCPTGGIRPETAEKWLAHPLVHCVGGSWLVPSGERDLDAIADRARAATRLGRTSPGA